MTRSTFGGTVNDVLLGEDSDGDLRYTSGVITWWDAKTGGTQWMDLQLNSVAVSAIPVSADGQVPAFLGPDGVTEMWADAGAGRVLVLARSSGGGGGSVADATTTVKGIVELATNTETTTGTDAVRATTPAGVAAVAATKQALQQVAAVVTASGAAVVNKHNPVDATGGAKSLSLPTGQAEGTQISIEKTDASTNAVSITGNIRGVGSSTIALNYQSESLMLRADSSGSWWPVAGHRTKTSLDAAYVRLPASPTDGQHMAWNATAGLWVPINPAGSSEIFYVENNTGTVTTIPNTAVATDIAGMTGVIPAGSRGASLSAQCLFKNTSGGTGSTTARALLLITEVSNGVDTPVQYAFYVSMAGVAASWVSAAIVLRKLGVPARTRTFKLQALANIACTVDNGNASPGVGASWMRGDWG